MDTDTLMRVVMRVIMSLAVLASWPVEALAADGVKEGNGDDHPIVTTSLSLERVDRSDIDGTDASIEYTEFAAGLEWQLLLFDIDHREYDWRNGASYGINPGLDPWKTLTRIAPGLQYYRELPDNWSVWATFAAIAGFEDDISSRSWTYNPEVLGFHMPTQRMMLYSGLGMLYHPVDSVVYPVLGVAWNMESKDGFSGAVGFPEAMVRYGFNERVALKIDFQWDTRTYRLAKDSNVAPEGYVLIDDLVSGLQLEYEPIKGLTLRFGIRQYYERKLTVFDREENELKSNEQSESWTYLLGVEYKL